MKLCECGCGKDAGIYRQTVNKIGVKKGQQRRFLPGHIFRIKRKGSESPSWKGGRYKRNGYVFVKCDDHPSAVNSGYVQEHRLIVESVIDRYLKPSECVHHIDGKESNNNNDNLVVCENGAYHSLIHKRQHALKTSGHSDWLKCPYCKKYDSPDNLTICKNKVNYHKKCLARYHYRRKNGFYKEEKMALCKV